MEPRSPALQMDSLPAEPQGKPCVCACVRVYICIYCVTCLLYQFIRLCHVCGAQVSPVVAHRLSCHSAGGIFVAQPGIEPASLALEGGLLISGPIREVPQFTSLQLSVYLKVNIIAEYIMKNTGLQEA